MRSVQYIPILQNYIGHKGQFNIAVSNIRSLVRRPKPLCGTKLTGTTQYLGYSRQCWLSQSMCNVCCDEEQPP
jgi:hypothetical protein